MKERRAYHRNDDGTLSITTLLVDDGRLCDPWGSPLTRTDKTEQLRGWPDEGTARVWLNEGGRELLVPEV